jgi:long-chain fatty acid transport protein
MGNFRSKAIVWLGLPFCVALSAPAGATSFYLNEQSIKGAGRAFSGEAADQGPESLWWNPAAIAGSDHISAAFGAALIVPHANVRDNATLITRPGQPTAPVGGDPNPHNPARTGLLPSGAIAVPITDRIAFGVALSSPFSFTTDYHSNSWTRYIADRTRLLTIDIQPSIGIKVTDMIRVGGALNVEYSDATLQKELPNLSPALPDGTQALKGDGVDFGWSAGAQLVTPRLTAGISYKSAIRHTYHGTLEIAGLLGPLAGSNGTIHTTANFRTPWQAIAGVRFKATDAVTLNLQAIRFGWKKFDRIRLSLPAGAFVPEEYRNTWMIAGGADWAISPDWTLRVGAYRDETPTQDGRRDPNVPDANRTAVTTGASHRISRTITIDAAAEYIIFDHSSVDRQTIAFEGSPVATPVITNGRLASAHAIVLGLGGRFSF